MPTLLLPGDTAPPLQSQAVRQGDVVDLTLDDALKGAEYLMLVFYPADFTFVCPTEIVQFTEKHAEFEEQRCNVVCCSTDSVYTHLAWLKAPKAERGLGATNSSSIVLLSDRSHEISRAYGVLAASGAAYRGTFLIDKDKKVCQVTINDMPVGRSVDDALRMLTQLRASRILGEQSGKPTATEQQANASNAKHPILETSRRIHQRTGAHQRQDQQRALPIYQVLTNPERPLGKVRHGIRQHQEQQQHQQNNQCQYQCQQPSVTWSDQSETRLSGDHDHHHQPHCQPSSSADAAAVVGIAAQAAQLETRAAQLRLQDSEARLMRLLADANRICAEADRQKAETDRLRSDARQKMTEWDRLVAASSGAPLPM